MIHYKDLFYSFRSEEIAGFDEIGKEALTLSTVPVDFNEDVLRDRIGSDRFLTMRKSLETRPDKVKALEHEAKAHLNKVLPRLSDKVAEHNHKPNEKWSFRPGHIAFNPAFKRLGRLNQLLDDFFDFQCKDAGDFLYPPGGFRGWHTNKYDLESWFAFFVDIDQPKGSFFRFIDPETDELITHWDEPGTVNIFRISSTDLLWHCIGTENCHRWSQGFTLPDNWKERIHDL
jgi:hypothetical protein